MAEILTTDKMNNSKNETTRIYVDTIIDILDAKVYYMPDDFNTPICCAGASDLLSDVLAFTTRSAQNMILLTGLCTLQVIRTVSLLDIPVVMFARGKKPSAEMLQLAEENRIVVLGCRKTIFYASALLYNAGIRPLDEHDDFILNR